MGLFDLFGAKKAPPKPLLISITSDFLRSIRPCTAAIRKIVPDDPDRFCEDELAVFAAFFTARCCIFAMQLNKMPASVINETLYEYFDYVEGLATTFIEHFPSFRNEHKTQEIAAYIREGFDEYSVCMDESIKAGSLHGLCRKFIFNYCLLEGLEEQVEAIAILAKASFTAYVEEIRKSC